MIYDALIHSQHFSPNVKLCQPTGFNRVSLKVNISYVQKSTIERRGTMSVRHFVISAPWACWRWPVPLPRYGLWNENACVPFVRLFGSFTHRTTWSNCNGVIQARPCTKHSVRKGRGGAYAIVCLCADRNVDDIFKNDAGRQRTIHTIHQCRASCLALEDGLSLGRLPPLHCTEEFVTAIE